jgi:hypothetical protein
MAIAYNALLKISEKSKMAAIQGGTIPGGAFSSAGNQLAINSSMDNLMDMYEAVGNDMFKINFDSGKTALIMGDCMHESCKEIALAYREYLKCDWLQVTHHGVIGGNKWLYSLADPDICFWPVTKQGFEGTFSWEKYHWCLGDGGCDYNAFLRDDNVKKRTHYTNEKIITLIAD